MTGLWRLFAYSWINNNHTHFYQTQGIHEFLATTLMMKCIFNKQTEYKTKTVNGITDIIFLMTRNDNEGFDDLDCKIVRIMIIIHFGHFGNGLDIQTGT